MKIKIFIILSLLITLNISSFSQEGTRYALLVGIDRYSPAYGPGNLPSCINDANGMRNILMLGDTLNRWDSENLQTLNDAQATESTIRTELQTLASQCVADDIVVYFHSSHGGRYSGTNAFVCTYNANYDDTELGTDLALFNPSVKVIVIIDTCYSAGMFKDTAKDTTWDFAKNAMESYKKTRTQYLISKGQAVPKDLGSNVAFMTACDYDETAWAGAIYSLYTEYLLEASLMSASDTNEDGQSQFLEIHTYADSHSLIENPGQDAQTFNNTLLNSIAVRTNYPSESGADTYETDNSKNDAKIINSEESQAHSIVPANDQDWLYFTLTYTSNVIIEVAGISGDTRMWLYQSDGTTQIEYDDDDGIADFSRIERELLAGTYYIKIDEYGNNNTISAYNISFIADNGMINGEVVRDGSFGSNINWQEWQLSTGNNVNVDFNYTADGPFSKAIPACRITIDYVSGSTANAGVYEPIIVLGGESYNCEGSVKILNTDASTYWCDYIICDSQPASADITAFSVAKLDQNGPMEAALADFNLNYSTTGGVYTPSGSGSQTKYLLLKNGFDTATGTTMDVAWDDISIVGAKLPNSADSSWEMYK